MTPQEKQRRFDAESKRYEHEPMLSAEERAQHIALEAKRLGITPGTTVTDAEHHAPTRQQQRQ